MSGYNKKRKVESSIKVCKKKDCGQELTIKESKTELNLGRKFLCCPEHGYSGWITDNSDNTNTEKKEEEKNSTSSQSKQENQKMTSTSKDQVYKKMIYEEIVKIRQVLEETKKISDMSEFFGE